MVNQKTYDWISFSSMAYSPIKKKIDYRVLAMPLLLWRSCQKRSCILRSKRKKNCTENRLVRSLLSLVGILAKVEETFELLNSSVNTTNEFDSTKHV